MRAGLRSCGAIGARHHRTAPGQSPRGLHQRPDYGARSRRQAHRPRIIRSDLHDLRGCALRHQPGRRRRALHALFPSRPARAARARAEPHSRGRRGVPAHRQQRLLHLSARGDVRYRGRRHRNSQRHGGAALAASRELRSRGVCRPDALRYPSPSEADHGLRRRAASLHRQHSRPHHDHDRDPQDARAIPRCEARRPRLRSGLRRCSGRAAVATSADEDSVSPPPFSASPAKRWSVMPGQPRVAPTALALLMACSLGTASAQAPYPSQAVRLVVPYAAGGVPDTVARFVGQGLQERLGQSVVVENRPGGNGSVAAATITGGPADGYTLLVTDSAMLSVNPLFFKQLAYNPQKDFIPVALLARAPLFLAVHSGVPVATLREFIDYVKARPGQINYGSSGIGSTHHLTMEAVKAALDLNMTHVPYRGTGQSVPALLGGHVQVLFSAYPSLKGAVESNRVKLIATNGAQRSPLAPDVPSLAEV